MTGQSYSVKEVAGLLKCRTHKVTALIHSGQLRAVNIALKANGKKPRWIILSEDFDNFLMRRTLKIAGPRPRRTSRKNVIEFF